MAEVDSVLEDKNQALADVMRDLQKHQDRELSSLASVQDRPKSEQALLEILAMIIDQKESSTTWESDKHGHYFLNREECLALFEDRIQFDYNDACFRRLKDFITKTQPLEYAKPPIVKTLYTFLSEMFRKQNVRNTMS
jgi:hypothetical protein